MELGDRPAIDAWRLLAGGSGHSPLQVVVNPESWLAPAGWIGIAAISNVVTASVPTAELREIVESALTGLSGDEATNPEVVAPRLTPTASAVGPAQLFYLPRGFQAPAEVGDEALATELGPLLGSALSEDLDESGLAHIESPAFVSRSSDGTVVSACGYRRWPNGVAHLSVLTHREHRRNGHGRLAAAGAVRYALGEGFLPQWRARPVESQRVALAVGFVRMGAQLSLQPA